jgi:undecaprenyl pyrophosphate phosphatase UppP
MLFGADRRSAAEFSFSLAMPTMVGAFAYEVFKSRGDLAVSGNVTVVAVGFIFSFIFGWIVVKTFPGYAAAQLALFAVAYSRGRRRPICALYSVEPSGDAATELTGPAKPPQI